MTDEVMLRNRCELLRVKYSEVINQEMPRAVLRQLLLALIGGTPWQYYDYALDEAALAPAPSWRYVMAIVNRLVSQAVPVEKIREPKAKKKGRILSEQDYAQRDYADNDDILDRMMQDHFAAQGKEVRS